MDHTKEFTISEILVELDNAIEDGTIPKNGAFATMRDEISYLRAALAEKTARINSLEEAWDIEHENLGKMAQAVAEKTAQVEMLLEELNSIIEKLKECDHSTALEIAIDAISEVGK